MPVEIRLDTRDGRELPATVPSREEVEDSSRLREIERVREIGSNGIAGSERRKAPSVLDERED